MSTRGWVLSFSVACSLSFIAMLAFALSKLIVPTMVAFVAFMASFGMIRLTLEPYETPEKDVEIHCGESRNG